MQSVYHASVTMNRNNKFTMWLVHSTVIYMSKCYRQKLVTNAHLEMGHYLKCHISRWNIVSLAWHAVTSPCLVARTFGLGIGIVGTVSVWWCCECEANASENLTKQQRWLLEGSWPIAIHFQWPCLSDFLCMVRGSSDLCRLCQFLWDSAEQTTLSRNMWLDSGRRFPLVYICVLVYQNRKRVISGTRRWNWSAYCICALSRLILWNNTQMF